PCSVTTPAPTPTSTLSLHDALPICARPETQESRRRGVLQQRVWRVPLSIVLKRVVVQLGALARFTHRRERHTLVYDARRRRWVADRKSTRLNSSHVKISYAVFCLKK